MLFRSVGTGVEGRVYTVDENHTSMLVADIDGRQVGALSLSGKRKGGSWTFPASQENGVRKLARDLFGTNGDDGGAKACPPRARLFANDRTHARRVRAPLPLRLCLQTRPFRRMC